MTVEELRDQLAILMAHGERNKEVAILTKKDDGEIDEGADLNFISINNLQRHGTKWYLTTEKYNKAATPVLVFGVKP